MCASEKHRPSEVRGLFAAQHRSFGGDGQGRKPLIPPIPIRGDTNFNSGLNSISSNATVQFEAKGIPLDTKGIPGGNGGVVTCSLPGNDGGETTVSSDKIIVNNTAELDSLVRCFPAFVSASNTIVDGVTVDYTTVFPANLAGEVQTKYLFNQMVLPDSAQNMLAIQDGLRQLNKFSRANAIAANGEKELQIVRNKLMEEFRQCYMQYAKPDACRIERIIVEQETLLKSLKAAMEAAAQQESAEATKQNAVPTGSGQRVRVGSSTAIWKEKPNLCQAVPTFRGQGTVSVVEQARATFTGLSRSVCSDLLGCASYDLDTCTCGHCGDPVQGLGKFNAVSFCRNDTQCIGATQTCGEKVLTISSPGGLQGEVNYGVCIRKI